MLRLQQFKITYVYGNKPAEFLTRAEDGFDAERNFLIWAKDLVNPVRVVSVERITI